MFPFRPGRACARAGDGRPGQPDEGQGHRAPPLEPSFFTEKIRSENFFMI